MKTFYFLCLIWISLFLGCKKDPIGKNIANNLENNQIQELLFLSKSTDCTEDISNYLSQAYVAAQTIENDSTRIKSYLNISLQAYKNNDTILFPRINEEARKLALLTSDSVSLAETYWDLGGYSKRNSDYVVGFDAYLNASKIYKQLGDDLKSARMKINMAVIQTAVKDYLGSEQNTFEALSILKSLNNNRYAYNCYNNLGIIYNGLGDYQKAIAFHNKALGSQFQFSSNPYLIAITLNNLGVVYENKKDFPQAIEYYSKALEDTVLSENHPLLYAKLIDNRAYAYMKTENLESTKSFYKALKIRENLGDHQGIIVNKRHLAEYFLKEDSISAKKYALDAKELAVSTNNTDELLKSLIFLATLDEDLKSASLQHYVQLSDSLSESERKTRNKFARIRFETDEFIAENEALTKKNFWIITGASSILILLGLLYIIRIERNRNRQLILKQKQQLANEEIYNLLIDSQSKLDEGKEKEKKRISKELHDGILSKFFGVRLNLELLNNSISKDSIVQREKYILELKQLEKEIRTVSHQLNDDMFSTENSFKTIIKELLNSQKDLGSFKYKLKADDNIVWDEISSKIKINVYRIIQEGLHNIIKYSEAKFVEINFTNGNKTLKIEIKDDGIGFNTNATTDGIGLTNMKSRIKELNGKLDINSNNLGSNLIMYIPLYNN